jgi:CubicO group peptidase (beta-lactamase class C family)
MEQDLTLREALAEDRLDDFVRQEEDRGVVRFAALGELQGKGYGLAGALILEPSAFDHQTREASGGAGTQWWISPKKNTAGLIMAQREMGHPFVVEFKRLAYEAVKRKS